MAHGADTTPSTPHKSENQGNTGIVNRKREHRGLPGSFHSNLGQQVSPSPPRNDSKPNNNAHVPVKAIIAWLESSSKDTSTVSTRSGDSSFSRAQSSISPAGASPSPSTRPPQTNNIPMAPDVEDYSLTLLKYRKYFTGEPLGRCLDQKENCANEEKTQVTKSDTESSQPPAQYDAEQPPASSASCGTTFRFPHIHTAHAQTQNNSKKMANQCKARKNSDAKNSQLTHRDPKEVKAYWDYIRAYLAASDDELDTLPTPDTFDSRQAAVGTKNTTAGDAVVGKRESAPPHRKVRSEPNIVTGTPGGRRRFMSFEERMVVIDDFLGTGDKSGKGGKRTK